MSFAEIEELVSSLEKEEKLTLIDKIWGTMTISTEELPEEDQAILKSAQKREADADEANDWQEWGDFKSELRNRDR